MPTTRTPSLARIDTCELAIQQILDGAIPADVRTALTAAQQAVATLKPTTDPAQHMPIYVTALDGSTDRAVGCSCGATPKSRAARASTILSFYNTHLNKVGVPRTRANQEPRFTDGARAGMTWNEAYQANLT